MNVFDCGGRGGPHRSWKNFGLPLNYFSFEPESSEFSELKIIESEKQVGDLQFHSFNVALDEESGWSIFYVYEQKDLSSFFPLNISESYRYGAVPLIETTKVATVRLDELCDQKNIYPDFLSVDTQGATLKILKGGEKTLQHLLALRCEVEFIQLYKDAPLFNQVFSYLQDRSYKLLRIEMCGPGLYGVSTEMNKFSIGPHDGIPAACDAIFINTERLSDLELNLSNPAYAEKLAYLILFCIHNGCAYYGVEILERLRQKSTLEKFYNALTVSVLENLSNQVGVYLSILRSNINIDFDGASVFRSLFNKGLEESHPSYMNISNKIHFLYRKE